MHADSGNSRVIVVNKGPVLVVNNELLYDLCRKGTIDEIPIGVVDILQKIVEITQKYPELSIGFIKPKKGNVWLHLVLLQVEGGFQRVHLERLSCKECHWQGWTANPMITDLYFDIPDWRAALDEAFARSVLPCPVCTAVLPRHPIWIEPGQPNIG